MADGRRSMQSVLSVMGILVSAYAYHVETTKEQDSSYQAFCDLNENVSCSKVFTSQWGRGMGLIAPIFGKDSLLNQPNSVFGILFYILLIALDQMKPSMLSCHIQLLCSIISNMSSVWLAYILFIVLEDVCVVCVSMYFINAALFICSWLKYREVEGAHEQKTK